MSKLVKAWGCRRLTIGLVGKVFDEPIEKATEGSFKNKLEVQDCLGINDHVVYQNHLDLSDLLVNLSTGEAVVDISVLEGSLD